MDLMDKNPYPQIVLDERVDVHKKIGYFYRGRAHNGPDYLSGVEIILENPKGKLSRRTKDDLDGLRLRWKMQETRRDLAPHERNAAFTIVVAKDDGVYVTGTLAGDDYQARLPVGSYEWTLRLVSKDLKEAEDIVLPIQVEVTGLEDDEAVIVTSV